MRRSTPGVESQETMADKNYDIDIESTGHDDTLTVTRRGRGFRGRNDDAHSTARNGRNDRPAGTPGPATPVRCSHPKLPITCPSVN
jgi:hypothetical protein